MTLVLKLKPKLVARRDSALAHVVLSVDPTLIHAWRSS